MQIQNLALYILQNFSHEAGGISHLKLQKLLYYVKAWSMVADEPVICDPFYKWDYGPANMEVWQKFKQFKSEPLPAPAGTLKKTDPDEKNLIDFIVENYIDFSPLALSSMTHSEAPWKNTPQDSIIPDDLIKAYYSKQLFANNFPLSDKKPYYPVISDMDSAFILDMSTDDAFKSMVFPSYKEYKELKKKVRTSFEKNKKKWFKKLA